MSNPWRLGIDAAQFPAHTRLQFGSRDLLKLPSSEALQRIGEIVCGGFRCNENCPIILLLNGDMKLLRQLYRAIYILIK